MEGHPSVIEQLNRCLEPEWTAPEIYTVFASLFGVLGLPKLAEHWRKESAEERQHGERLADRIVFLEGTPTDEHYPRPVVPEAEAVKPPAIRKLLEAALALETEGRDRYREAITVCRTQADEVSAELLSDLLDATEEHIRGLEGDLAAWDLMGPENWLASKL